MKQKLFLYVKMVEKQCGESVYFNKKLREEIFMKTAIKLIKESHATNVTYVKKIRFTIKGGLALNTGKSCKNWDIPIINVTALKWNIIVQSIVSFTSSLRGQLVKCYATL